MRLNSRKLSQLDTITLFTTLAPDRGKTTWKERAESLGVMMAIYIPVTCRNRAGKRFAVVEPDCRWVG